MMSSDIHRTLVDFGFEYDKAETKDLSFGIAPELDSFLRTSKIQFVNRNGFIVVSRDDLPYTFFEDLDEFSLEVTHSHLLRDIVIKRYNDAGETLIFENERVFLNGDDVVNYLFNNAIAYHEAKKFFKHCHENSKDDDFEFVDFYSESKKVIVFTTISEKRRLKFEFLPSGAPPLNPEVDYLSKFNAFKESFEKEKQHFHVFLKNAMLSNLAGKPGDKFKSFFEELDKIVNDANLNFNVYLQGLSIEKIKSQYADYKNSYFKEQNEILGKISNQVIAFPFSISAIAFSISKLEGSIFAVSIIVLGIISYVFYTSFLARVLRIDLCQLSSNLNAEFTKLTDQEFFKDHSDELRYFKSIKLELDERIKKLNSGLLYFVFIVWLVSFLLIVYASQLIFKWEWSWDLRFMYSAVLLLFICVFFIVYQYLIICKSKERYDT